MRFNEFDWDDTNLLHIARHGVTQQEVEEACENIPFVVKTRAKRYLIYGRSDNGRYLVTIAQYESQQVLRVITSRDMTPTERQLYNRKKN